MAKFLYQLTFPSTTISPSLAQIQIFISQNRDIDSWYLPFAGCYIFKSNKTLFELQPQFLQFFGQSLFVISYVTPSLVGGSLPQGAWQWMNDLDNLLLPGS
jgi:hypothetical protein